jgi:hypothetical protein
LTLENKCIFAIKSNFVAKKTSGNSSFPMFFEGEKTLAIGILGRGPKKLKFSFSVVKMRILPAAKPAKAEEIADGIGPAEAEFLGVGREIELFDVGRGGGNSFWAKPAEYPPGQCAEAGRFAGIGIWQTTHFQMPLTDDGFFGRNE